MGNGKTDDSISMGGKNGKSTDLLACCILRVARKSASKLQAECQILGQT
jgi:hypothetical protein